MNMKNIFREREKSHKEEFQILCEFMWALKEVEYVTGHLKTFRFSDRYNKMNSSFLVGGKKKSEHNFMLLKLMLHVVTFFQRVAYRMVA